MAERNVTVEVDEEMWAVTSHLKIVIYSNNEWVRDITMPREATPLDIFDKLILEAAIKYDEGKTQMGEICFEACKNVPGMKKSGRVY